MVLGTGLTTLAGLRVPDSGLLFHYSSGEDWLAFPATAARASEALYLDSV